MKKLLFLFLFAITFNSLNAQNAKPTKEETYSYIKKILAEVEGYTVTYKNGAVDKISRNTILNYDIRNGHYYFSGEPLKSNLGCSDFNYYSNIDFSKLVGEPEDYDEIVISSSLKKLILTFKANSVLYRKSGSCASAHGEIPTSTVVLVYRNEEGVKERLVKAINHLAELEKKEAKENDPFGN